MSVAQRRPGPEPRQHRVQAWYSDLLRLAQRRPGPEPRQHLQVEPGGRHVVARSTKAGTGAPATPARAAGRDTIRGPLNEGRDRSPGNTARARRRGSRTSGAQRRPGPEPRQHLHVEPRGGHGVARSTKAGTGAPATRAALQSGHDERVALNEGRDRSPGNTSGWCGCMMYVCIAQRRPGPEPRQHPVGGQGQRRSGSRSTKAGTGAPATRAPSRCPGGRSSALNEGRDRSPGNTLLCGCVGGGSADRSTKAGTGAPATHRERVCATHHARVAQRRPGPEPRQHTTLLRWGVEVLRAQRRPGPEPRQHGWVAFFMLAP